mgnify:CR=1 FL=1|jgi:D-allulose-6-phosphate 3-epimerase
MKPEFSVSLMCMDFLDIRRQIETLNPLVDGYHIDIMDGHYCKNITFGPDFIRVCAQVAKKPMDVHLMTTDPNDWIDICARAGAALISPHAETINADCFRTLNRIRDAGCKVGVTLNPATPLDCCRYYLDRVDVLTLMTVDVGFAGQPFIAEMLEKVSEAKRLRKEKGWHYKIMIDGSCNEKTFGDLYRSGADVFVLGSSGLFSLDADLQAAFTKMKTQFEEKTGVRL